MRLQEQIFTLMFRHVSTTLRYFCSPCDFYDILTGYLQIFALSERIKDLLNQIDPPPLDMIFMQKNGGRSIIPTRKLFLKCIVIKFILNHLSNWIEGTSNLCFIM